MGDSSKTAGHHPDIALVATADTEASLLPAPDHWYTSMCTCGPLCTPWTHLGEWVRHCSAADPDPAASAVPTHTCLTLDPTEARPSLGPGTPDAGALPTGCQPQHQSLETLSGPHRRGPQLPRCHDTTVGVSSASTDDTPPPHTATCRTSHALCPRCHATRLTAHTPDRHRPSTRVRKNATPLGHDEQTDPDPAHVSGRAKHHSPSTCVAPLSLVKHD